jgi:hypothetical protein
MTNQQTYNLLNKQTAAKRESTGFNLDSLATPGIGELVDAYNQVEVRNGNQSILLNRSDNGGNIGGTNSTGTGTNPVDINAAGNLQIVPTVGGKAQAFSQAQATAAAQPSTLRALLPIGLALAGVVVIVVILKHHG